MQRAKVKALKAFGALFPLIGPRSGLSHVNKNMIYKSILRPIATYGAAVWASAASCHLKPMQIFQNRALKTINRLHWHWRHPTALMHQITGYQTITKFTTEAKSKFDLRCHASSFDHIRRIVESF